MCLSKTHRHSVFCILPPYVLNSIVKNGTPKQRELAIQTLSTDNTLRAIRSAQRQLKPSTVGRQASAMLEGQKRRIVYNVHNTQDLPGEVARTEGAPSTGDLAVDEAYDGLGATYDFFWETYERDSKARKLYKGKRGI
jgi:Zn-dependent metalloprotease